MASYLDFEKIDIRIGKIIAVEDFPKAKKPAYKLTVDFGKQIGIKHSSAQITNYQKQQLEGRLVVAVVNFPPKQVADFVSEVLVLGAITEEGVKLLCVDEDVKLGSKVA
ncbi:MAG: tRNA-binding protein [Candidatus Micrarchaeia archaeon]